MRPGLLLFICFFIAIPVLHAQAPARAQRFYNLAMVYEGHKDHERARSKMEEAIKVFPAFAEACSMLGAWYFQDHKFEKAASVFEKAYHNCRNGNITFAYPLAKSLLYSGRPGEALQLAGGKAGQWQKLREDAQFARSAQLTPWRDTIHNIGRPNTGYAELFPWISADEQKIFFTRRKNGMDEDFYVSYADSCGGWFTGKNMGSPPNTPSQEAAQSISADGHYLFFMRCENRSEDGWEQGGCDLYMSYAADSVWSVAQSFGATINSPAYEGMPCLSPDNRELYLVSDRAGGYGGLDIWVSRFENGLWQAPRNLGPEINTKGNETAPFLHTDNSTLYFSSDGAPGMGGSDFFISRKRKDTLWTKAVNLGYPINTSSDESSLSINIAGDRMYFASDRDGIAGDFNLYEMTLPPILRPVPVNVVKGFVYDSLSKGRLSYASIYVTDALTGQTLYHFNSNRGDGSFMITLPAGKKYYWHTDRVSFQDKDDTIDLHWQSLDTAYAYNMALLPSDYVAPVNDSLILTVYFPLNSAKLSDSDRMLIGKALSPWLDSKSALIYYVNGYTDNSGTPMLNEQLSYQRAGLVSKELMSIGIDELSIHTRGWGEANPVVPNDSEANMGRNRRVELIIRR